MVNLDKKVTIDDLIITYLAEKTKKGFIKGFTEKEFLDFLTYMKAHIIVNGEIGDYNSYVESFIERKNKNDWFGNPHIEFKRGVINPNYNFVRTMKV